MIVPVEILENILSKCDGKTLLAAKKVDDDWNSIVEYLTKKTRIWEWCCKEEIPNNELIEYIANYTGDDKWLGIYMNWVSWKDCSKISWDIILSPVEVPRICCIAVSGNFIAVGSEDGRLRIFNTRWEPIYAARHLAVKITNITFIDSTEYTLCIVLAYSRGLIIFCFDRSTSHKDELVIHDVKSHSIFKNYICYEKLGGRMTIAKLSKRGGRRELSEIWFSRIYSPKSLSCMNMWNGECIFLFGQRVNFINYLAKNLSAMRTMEFRTNLKYTFPSSQCQNRILRNDVIISLYKDKSLNGDFLEFFVICGSNTYKKKLFNTYEIFRCMITCIFVYGNTLILGVDIGNIYIYHVSAWTNLNLREYDKKLIIGKHPIISVAVKETRQERKFYVSSPFNIHEIVGFSIY